MLRINTLFSAESAKNYFRDALAQDDYYSEKGSLLATWEGKAAQRLGIQGKGVTAENFGKLCDNLNPLDGKRITVRNAKNRRPGYDLTFNAPKSLSILYAFTQDPQLLEAHKMAVKKAMEAVERDMQTQKGQGKEKTYVGTGNITYATFDHLSSRPVEMDAAQGKAYIPDPHMHTHCVVMNHTWSEENQRFQAVELGNIKKEAPYYEALYHSYLSTTLSELGYGVERTAKRWEMRGFDRKTIEKFSNRTSEILKSAQKKGLTYAQDIADEGRKTRNRKEKAATEKEVQENWKARLTPEESQLIASLSQPANTPQNLKDHAFSPEECIRLSLLHHLERKSVVSEKRLLAYAMSLGYATHPPEAIYAAYQARQDIIKAQLDDGALTITTQAVIDAERKMLHYASSSRGVHPALNPAYKIQQDFLNAGQRAAIQHVLNSHDGVTIVSGDAGTGKTTLMQEVKQGIEEAGKKFFAFAPSAEASRNILRSEGFEGADTIAKLLQDKDLQEKIHNQVILIDEAGMVGTVTMNKIFELAQEQNARIVLSGDWKQHKSVEAGDALKWLEIDARMPIARVKEILRQRKNEAFKAAVKSLADKNPLQAFKKLAEMESIHEIEDKTERNLALAQTYVEQTEAGKSVIFVSPTNAEGAQVTQQIRQLLKEKGKLGEDVKKLTHLPQFYTEAQKQDIKKYEKGMYVRFHQNAQGFEAGHSYEIRDVTENEIKVLDSQTNELKVLDLKTHSRFGVFQPKEVLLAEEEKIRITQNGRDIEGKSISNGQVYTVKRIDEQGKIHLQGGKVLGKDFVHLRLGYYETSHSSQGKTADTVLIAQSSDSFPASSLEQLYVSVSRGKTEVQVFTDDTQELMKWIERDSERISARTVQKHAVDEKRRQKLYQQTNEPAKTYQKEPEFAIGL